jgi:hypothetical protein
MDKFSFFNRRQFNNPFGGGKTFIWQLDETTGTEARERSGRYNGINTNILLDQPGKIGKSYEFNGVDSRCFVDNFRELNIQNYSCFFWVKIQNQSSIYMIISTQVSNSDHPLYCYLQNGKLVLSVTDNTGKTTLGSSKNLVDNEWHRACIVNKSGDVMKIYVDGFLDSSRGLNGTFTQGGSGNLVFGIRSESSSSFPYEGLLDQVIIVKDYMVTDAEVLKDWNEGNGQTYI